MGKIKAQEMNTQTELFQSQSNPDPLEHIKSLEHRLELAQLENKHLRYEVLRLSGTVERMTEELGKAWVENIESKNRECYRFWQTHAYAPDMLNPK